MRSPFSSTLAEHRLEGSQQCSGNKLGAFRRRMYAIGLNCPGYTDQILVDHGHQSGSVLCREVDENLIELVDVIRPVVGRKCDTCKQDTNVGRLNRREDRIEIAVCLFQGKPAEPVVPAKLDDHDRGVRGNDRVHTGHGVFRCRTTDSHVLDMVGVAQLVEIPLQCVGIGLSRVQAIARGDAVSKTDQPRPIGTECRSADERNEKRNEKGTPHVH